MFLAYNSFLYAPPKALPEREEDTALRQFLDLEDGVRLTVQDYFKGCEKAKAYQDSLNRVYLTLFGIQGVIDLQQNGYGFKNDKKIIKIFLFDKSDKQESTDEEYIYINQSLYVMKNQEIVAPLMRYLAPLAYYHSATSSELSLDNLERMLQAFNLLNDHKSLLTVKQVVGTFLHSMFSGIFARNNQRLVTEFVLSNGLLISLINFIRKEESALCESLNKISILWAKQEGDIQEDLKIVSGITEAYLESVQNYELIRQELAIKIIKAGSSKITKICHI